MATKKSSRRGIVFPVFVSVVATIAVFAAAEYVFHLPSRLWTNNQPASGNHVVRPTGSFDKATPSTGSVEDLTESLDETACTLEYFPVCGADGHTYSNPCMANRAKTIVARDGSCESDVNSSTISGEEMVTDFNTGSYLYYQNANYSLYLPRYVYFSGFGARDGANHTLGIALTATGADTFDTADVKVYFYRTEPASPPRGERISVVKGILYVDSDITINPKIVKIIDTIRASAK